MKRHPEGTIKRINLKELQEKNCRGCLYANQENVGTGKACCTCPGIPRIQDNKCLTRKEDSLKESTGVRK